MTTYREKGGPPYKLNAQGADYANKWLNTHGIIAKKGQEVEVSPVQRANLPNAVDLSRPEWPQRIAIGQDQDIFQ